MTELIDIIANDNEIPNYDLAVSVLDDSKNYRTGVPKFDGFIGDHKILSIDCEMVWVKKRTGSLDLRHSPELGINYYKEYRTKEEPNLGIDGKPIFNQGIATVKKINLKGYEGKKEADKAKSFVEFYGKDYIEEKTGMAMIGRNLEPLNRAFEAHLKNIVHACAQVTIVDWNGKVIYEKYVNGFDTDVEWTSGLYSGIPQDFYKIRSANYHKLLNGTKIPDDMFDSYANIKAEVLRLLTQVHDSQTKGIGGKPFKCETIVVGHNLIKSDIPSLEIDIMDRRFINLSDPNYGKVLYRDLIRDTNIYFGKQVGDRVEGPKLKDAVKKYLNKTIQAGTKGHDPSEDARASLALYKLNYNIYDRTFNNNQTADHDPEYTLPRLLKLLAYYTNNENRTGQDKSVNRRKLERYIRALLN